MRHGGFASFTRMDEEVMGKHLHLISLPLLLISPYFINNFNFIHRGLLRCEIAT